MNVYATVHVRLCKRLAFTSHAHSYRKGVVWRKVLLKSLDGALNYKLCSRSIGEETSCNDATIRLLFVQCSIPHILSFTSKLQT